MGGAWSDCCRQWLVADLALRRAPGAASSAGRWVGSASKSSDSLGGSYLGMPGGGGPAGRAEAIARRAGGARDGAVSRRLSAAHPRRPLHTAHRHGASPPGCAERSALHLCTEARAIHLRPDGSVEVEIYRTRRLREHARRPLRRRRPGRPPALDAGRAQAQPDAGDLPDAPCHAVAIARSPAPGSREPIEILAGARPAADPDPGRLAQAPIR